MKKRPKIPRQLKRELLIEAGFRCSIPHCFYDSSLEFNHIDGNPSNNTATNLLVVCSNHHTLCTIGRIDAKACREIKKQIKPYLIQTSLKSSDYNRIRKILRDELSTEKSKSSKKLPVMFPSFLEVRFLRQVLSANRFNQFELYTALTITSEKNFRGCTSLVIGAANRIVENKKNLGRKNFRELYFATIKCLIKLDTILSVNYLADEFFKGRDSFVNFIILIALSGSSKAKRYVGFKELQKKQSQKTFKWTVRLRKRTVKLNIKLLDS